MSLVTCTYPNNRIFSRLPDLQSLLGVSATEAPATRIYEDKDKYQVQLDLPGVRKEDVKIVVEAGQLSIEAVRNLGQGDQAKSYTLSRTFVLPEEVVSEKIAAEQKDGVLTLTLPKKEEAKPKTISINVN